MSNWGDLKDRAKREFYNNYLTLVVMGLIFAVISMIGNGSTLSKTLLKINFLLPDGVERFLITIKTGNSLLALLFSLFIGSAAWLASAYVGLKAYRGEKPEYNDLLLAFREGRYIYTVCAYALVSLIVMAGLILLIVPGIIAACGLSQVPYLMADDPSLDPIEAMKVSWRLMKGKKGDIFLFWLSFIGWVLLSIITFGIVMVLFAGPYMRNAFAGYHELVCAEYDATHA